MTIRPLPISPVRAALLGIALLLAAPVAAQQQPPSPEAFLGHRVGADGQLADWSQITAYFERLGHASPLIRVDTIGETVLGRPMIMAVATSAANHRRLETIRAQQARLADPRGVPAAELERLEREQPAVLFIGASLHGNEIMATQMAMELGWLLATDADYGRALENVVVLLVPGMNPDGLDIVRDWYLRTRGTRHAGAPLPWLYHHYTGHDNNRDFFMITQPETRAVSRVLYERWFPNVVWDVHQFGNRGARFFIPPFADPLNPNLDPLIVRLTNVVGTQMALGLTAAGKRGVSHQQTFDLWWHGGGRTVPARHNMVGILSEAASVNVADPVYLPLDSIRQPELGSMFPDPWEGGWWRARDIVEYELVAARALIGLLSAQRTDFARHYRLAAERQVERGREGSPFAYLLPPEQRDPGSAAELLRVLRRGGVEVHEARAGFTAGGTTHPAGTRVILMAQPYRAHAKDLLEVQRYPDRRLHPGGPPAPPYDVAGWTLPLQMGVEVREISLPFDVSALARVDSFAPPRGTVSGAAASAYALDPRVNAAHRAVHEVLGAGGRVSFLPTATRAGEESWPAGAPVVSGLGDLPARAARWAAEWGLDAAAVGTPPAPALERLRVGLYKPWTASMDEGWTRFVFEEWGVPFDTIHDARIRRGGLLDEFDAIVVPAMPHRQIVRGFGSAATPEEFAGGIGDAGTRALVDFVEGGGTLVLLDAASEFAIRELGVPVRDVNAAQEGSDPHRWFAPGSLLRVVWDASHPVGYGMPPETAVYYARSPVFEVLPGARGVHVVARYPDAGILLSGYTQGEERIAGHAALVEAEVGRGRVVMFGFRPQHRAQPHQTFKALFNALYRGAGR